MLKYRISFHPIRDHLAAKDGVRLEFVPREGLTYSLRAASLNQTERSLFVMVDVIEDDPRWLSVCFDIESYDADRLAYVTARIDEAWRAATGR